jgi:hypothetical protein
MQTQQKNAVKPVNRPPSPAASFTTLLQRKCACGGSPGVSGECEECSEKRLQREMGNSRPQIGTASRIPPVVHEVLRSAGQPLDAETRAFMEPRFGHDFANVRVHTDTKAAESARAVSALAYTVGNNVVFGENRYAPSTQSGRQLLAHELAHTIQQRGASSRAEPVPRGSSLELEAEQAGRDVAKGHAFSGSLGSSEMAVARQPATTDDKEEEEEIYVSMALPTGRGSRVAPSPRRGASKSAPGRLTTSALIQLDPRQVTDEELDLLPQVGSIEQARRMLRARKVEEAAGPKPDPLKVAAAQKENRRNRTIRFFRKIPDEKLEAAYRSRLRLYLDDRSKGQEYWDLEAMEEIVRERAPNASWREEARQEFLAQLETQKRGEARQRRLAQLPEKVRSQFQKLDDQTRKWAGEERDLARNLLWRWIELYDQGLGSRAATDRVRTEIIGHYETWLRAADRAIQADCKSRPRPAGLADKIRRNLEKAHGDACAPWFEESHQHGYSELHGFDSFLRVTTDYEKPEFKMYLNIHAWVQEFRGLTNPEAILARMRGQGVIGIASGGFGGLGSRVFFGVPKVAPTPQVAPIPTAATPKRPIGFELPHQKPPAPPVPEPQVLQTVRPSRRVSGFARPMEPKPEPVPLTPSQSVPTEMPRVRVVQGDQPTYGQVAPYETPGQGPATKPSRRVTGFQKPAKDVAETGLVEVDIGPREYVKKEHFGDVGASGEQQSRYHVNIQLDEQGMMDSDFVLRGGGRRSGSLFGKQEFLEAKQHFEQANGPGSVKGARGRWSDGDNLETFNERFKLWKSRGLSDEAAMTEAARKTRTGEWAGAAGFKNVKITKTEGPAGAFTNVEVEFTK